MSQIRPVGPEFRLICPARHHCLEPTATASPDGGFVITWTSHNHDGSALGTYAQRYDAAGAPEGKEFAVDTLPRGRRSESFRKETPDGSVAIWTSVDPSGPGWGLYGQRYGAIGEPRGERFRVDSCMKASEPQFSAIALPDGGFVVFWASDARSGSSTGIYGRRYDTAGAPQGIEFRVSSYSGNDQIEPSATELAGGFVVAWTSYDQDGYGIYAQRFIVDALPADQGVADAPGEGDGPAGRGHVLHAVGSAMIRSSPVDQTVAALIARTKTRWSKRSATWRKSKARRLRPVAARRAMRRLWVS